MTEIEIKRTTTTKQASLTEPEIDAIVRGYPDEKLAALYQKARKQPGTDWARRLSAEIGRRDALGSSQRERRSR